MTETGLLEGIRVLDLSRVMSGPFCTSMLADLGAEVIKIELPGHGEEGRSFGPFKDGESAYFMLLNRNKKSVTVNLKSPEGRELVEALIPECDVLVENFRPGVMARMKLDEAAVRQLNPSIIFASISGFGQDSPIKDLPAFDLVIQAMSGLMSLTGPSGGPATAVGESVADVCAGMFAAFGIMAALFQRERTGEGRSIDVSMLDSMLSMQLTGLARQLYMNDTPKPVGNRHPVTYPVDSFPARSGQIVLVCFSDALFAKLARVIGNESLADDARFRTNGARSRNDEALRNIISGWTASKTQEQAVSSLIDAGIPAAPVLDLGQAVATEHASARGIVANGRHSALGEIPLVAQPVRFSGAPRRAPTAPALGEHTEEVLGGIAGVDSGRLRRLKKKKVI